MTPRLNRRSAALIALVALGLGGCTKLRSHQGYVVDADLVNAVRAGVDTRDSVMGTLGQPTFVGQFDDHVWYYVSRDSSGYAYNLPSPIAQMTIKVTFDDKGNVIKVENTGLDKVSSVTPYGKTTPTLGRKRGFFQDLFGNIGTVGAGGVGGAGGGGGGGDGS